MHKGSLGQQRPAAPPSSPGGFLHASLPMERLSTGRELLLLGASQVFQELRDPAGLVSSPCRTLLTLHHRHPTTHPDPQLRAPRRWTRQEGDAVPWEARRPAPQDGAGLRLPACRLLHAACCTHTGGTEHPTGGASLDALLRLVPGLLQKGAPFANRRWHFSGHTWRPLDSVLNRLPSAPGKPRVTGRGWSDPLARGWFPLCAGLPRPGGGVDSEGSAQSAWAGRLPGSSSPTAPGVTRTVSRNHPATPRGACSPDTAPCARSLNRPGTKDAVGCPTHGRSGSLAQSTPPLTSSQTEP